MNELSKRSRQQLGILLRQGGNPELPKPFERDIFLFDSHIAGTTHIPGMEDIAPSLKEGDALDFFREPDNPHDPEAIVIKNRDGIKIGYVPRADNLIFSRLMDAGKLLLGKIASVEEKGKWIKIGIRIYLRE